MRKYILLVCFLSVYGFLNAQTKAVSFTVDGLKVILKQTQKETVSIAMFYKGGVMNYEPAQAGIENLALASAALCGTKNYSVADYQELADEYGIRISGASTTDYGIISMECISKYLEQGWKLFSDAVVNPSFDQNEFQNTKQKMLSAVFQSQSDPETRVEQLIMDNLFKDKHYGTYPLGNSNSLNALNVDLISAYYHNQMLNKDKMFLVVAGNITKEDLEKKIKAVFSSIPSKKYENPSYEHAFLTENKLVVEQRDLATNYMSIVMNAPNYNSPDYPAFVLLINVLSGNLSYELRTKLGLSYDPGASINMQQIPYSSMSVSTTQPKKAFKALIGVFEAVQDGKYSDEYINALKKDHRDKYYRTQESASAIVSKLGKAEILGDYKLEEEMVANFNKVTVEQVKSTFNKYIKGKLVVFLGDEQVGRDAFK